MAMAIMFIMMRRIMMSGLRGLIYLLILESMLLRSMSMRQIYMRQLMTSLMLQNQVIITTRVAPHRGKRDEYYTIMRVAEKSMKSLYLTGIGSNRGITISKLYHKIDPDLLANNNDALPLDTKADLLEFAELTVEIGYYDIAMYSNYEILKKSF